MHTRINYTFGDIFTIVSNSTLNANYGSPEEAVRILLERAQEKYNEVRDSLAEHGLSEAQQSVAKNRLDMYLMQTSAALHGCIRAIVPNIASLCAGYKPTVAGEEAPSRKERALVRQTNRLLTFVSMVVAELRTVQNRGITEVAALETTGEHAGFLAGIIVDCVIVPCAENGFRHPATEQWCNILSAAQRNVGKLWLERAKRTAAAFKNSK